MVVHMTLFILSVHYMTKQIRLKYMKRVILYNLAMDIIITFVGLRFAIMNIQLVHTYSM